MASSPASSGGDGGTSGGGTSEGGRRHDGGKRRCDADGDAGGDAGGDADGDAGGGAGGGVTATEESSAGAAGLVPAAPAAAVATSAAAGGAASAAAVLRHPRFGGGAGVGSAPMSSVSTYSRGRLPPSLPSVPERFSTTRDTRLCAAPGRVSDSRLDQLSAGRVAIYSVSVRHESARAIMREIDHPALPSRASTRIPVASTSSAAGGQRSSREEMRWKNMSAQRFAYEATDVDAGTGLSERAADGSRSGASDSLMNFENTDGGSLGTNGHAKWAPVRGGLPVELYS